MSKSTDFLGGVIEGFYGQPWSLAERFELFDWMSAWGLDTYLYAPKDDLKHRALWRESYTEQEAGSLRQIIQRCGERAIRFIYALAPGLDITYSSETDLACLQRRFEEMLALGCQHFALLFDDIPQSMCVEDAARFGSFASAQAHITNAVFQWTRERSPSARFLFCATAYCGRMVKLQFGGADYLETLGRELLPEINVFWTGPEIISRQITAGHIREIGRVLRRKPVLWDNLHANDYDGTRFYCGPYAGRESEVRLEVNGILSNPNNEFPLNFVPLRTLAAFLAREGEWDARTAFLRALAEWEPRFATATDKPITFQQLNLFADCFYLPHADGPEADALCSGVSWFVHTGGSEYLSGFQDRAGELREFCQRVTELRDRPLFYALSRRVWDLREELDLLERYIEWRRQGTDAPFTSDFHLPQLYRGGFVRRLQMLLRQNENSFAPNNPIKP